MKKIRIILVLIIFIIMGFTGKESDPTSVNNTTSINGSIKDLVTGEMLAGVEVYIVDMDIKTYTDLNGEFNFINLDKEKVYDIRVSLISYKKSYIENVKLNTRLDVKLIGY